MAGLTYLLDTNVISDLLKRHQSVYDHLQASLDDHNPICICQPVIYEVLRGLLWAGATSKEAILRNDFLPLFQLVAVTDDDWSKAAHLWADAVKAGKQLADMDFLIAAIAIRLDVTIVSSDQDFDALPAKRVDWRL